MIVTRLNKNNYVEAVLQHQGLALVDFYAAWSDPCIRMSPIVKEIAQENPEIAVGTVNIDWHPKLTAQYGVTDIPTLIVYRDGQEVSRMVGFYAKEKILKALRP